MAQVYGLGGLINVPGQPYRQNNAPPSNLKGDPGQWFFDQSQDPPAAYVYNGETWVSNQLTLSTDDTFAAASNSTASSSLAIKTYVDGIAIAGAPPASEVTPGIAELATQAEAETGTNDTDITTPLKVTQLLDSGNHSASFTTLALSGAVTVTGGLDVDTTGAISLDADSASNFSVAGAGIDLTLASAAGRVVINGEEAAADAIRLLSAAGGLDADVALQMNLVSSQNAADAIVINASAGGIDVTAAGAAGEDLDLTCTSGSVNIVAGENAADAITLAAASGGIDITCGGGSGEDIDLVNTAGSIHLNAGEAASDAINIDSSGGVDVDAVGQINLASSQNAATAIVINASAGGIDITAAGGAAEDIDIVNTAGSVNITAGEDDAGAIYIHADAGTSERVRIHSDQGTGADSVLLDSDVGGITLSSGLASADAINLNASGGGVDIDGALQVNIASSQDAASAIVVNASAGGIDITAAGAAGEDVDITCTSGSVNIVAGEADAAAMSMQAAAGGLDVDVALQMSLVSSQNAADAIVINASAGGIDLTAAGGAAEDIDITCTSGSVNIVAGEADAAAMSMQAAAGGLDVDVALQMNLVSSQNAADAIVINASAGGIDITAVGAAAEDLDLACTNGSTNITAGEAAADAITIQAASGGVDIDGALQVNIASSQNAADAIRINASAGGIDIDAAGAAGEDIVITNTAGSMTLEAGESVADAMNITASGAAGAINLSSGTGGVVFDSGITVNITQIDDSDSAYAVLGSDYVIGVNTSGGIVEVDLPASPATGRKLTIADVGGAAAGTNITIDGNGNNLVGGGASTTTKTIATNYMSAILTFDGSVWIYQEIA